MEQDKSKKSLFTNIEDIPIDPIFGMLELFLNDTRKEKINLSAGILIEEDGSPAKPLQSVHLAEEKIVQKNLSKIYLPIDGDKEYVEATGRFIFGDLYSSTIYGAQTVGGTSALHIIGDFLKRETTDCISLSMPTWANHIQIFKKLGFTVDFYPYYLDQKVDFARMKQHLASLKENTAILLQPSSHNPTGLDLTKGQWKELSDLFKEKNLIPFFDSAYQGLGQDSEDDVWPIRLFIKEGHELFVAHSYSKSMGLYNERVGALFVSMRDKALCDRLARNIRFIIRTNYSNPPHHGAHIAKLLHLDQAINPIWKEELNNIQQRLHGIRIIFADKLENAISVRNFDHIRNGYGFFTLLGLTPSEVAFLQKEYALYMTQGSRINIAAINEKNIDRIVLAIKKAVGV